MRYHKIFLFILFCFFGSNAFAVIFTVTSNADSGPGTLRDALTQAAANGTAVKDYIYFNIVDQSVAGRTITLLSALPNVTSNLVIDGTTQPGNAFGVSDSKISIQPGGIFDAFDLVNVDGFELYGLYIHDFSGDYGTRRVAISVLSSKNIQIGAPGKGNVFNNNLYTLSTYWINYSNDNNLSHHTIENLTVYSNIIGFMPDGKTFNGAPLGLAGGFDISGASGNITFGGTDAQRNVFGNTATPIESRAIFAENTFPAAFNIINNYFNYCYDGSVAPLPALNTSNLNTIIIGQAALGQPDENLPYKLYFNNNKAQAPASISAGSLTGEIIFQGNTVKVENYPNKPSYAEGGVGFLSSDRILIGGENPGEPNSLEAFEIYGLSTKSFLIQHNSIYCHNEAAIWRPDISPILPVMPLPIISITNITDNSVSGTATPLSKIELFWDDDCQYCQPLTYVATVNADASGNWQFNSVIQKGVIASASLNGYTSLFTQSPRISTTSKAKKIHYSCGQPGSITGLNFLDAGAYQWKDANGNVISNSIDVNNLQPGTYTLSALNSSCTQNFTYTVYDATPKIIDNGKRIVNPSCTSKGSITYLGYTNDMYNVMSDTFNNGFGTAYSFQWTDAGGNIRGNSIDLANVEAGSYTLTVTYNFNPSCTTTYGPVILTNTTGPNINQSAMVVQSTPCGQSTGAIKGITATGSGTLNYVWKNAAGTQVGTSADLLNQPAGQYTLQVTDNTTCGPVYSSAITIVETNGITMDESSVKTTITSCGLTNGTITGIQVSGATQYQWRDASNKVVANVVDLTDVTQGDYTLTTTNIYGCTKVSKTYHVGQQVLTIYPKYAASIISACYWQANGSIAMTFDALVTSARWVYQGVTVGSGSSISNLTAGTYQLYLTDANGCEQLYNSYTVSMGAQLQLTRGAEQVNNDGCSLKTGSVINVQVTGGFAPYTYGWTDATGKIVSSSADLTNIGAGTYTVKITDSRSCATVTETYVVQNQDNVIAPPVANNVQICGQGNAIITVSNPLPTLTYKLYASTAQTSPISITTDGHFAVNVKTNTIYYISQASGSCESSRIPVTVSVGISTADIPNTITPNADGINDYWKIPGIENYPQAAVHIYNRNGQLVYESRGYATPFNGIYNGKLLPYGTYYYLIELSNSCNLLSGSLTIVR